MSNKTCFARNTKHTKDCLIYLENIDGGNKEVVARLLDVCKNILVGVIDDDTKRNRRFVKVVSREPEYKNILRRERITLVEDLLDKVSKN